MRDSFWVGLVIGFHVAAVWWVPLTLLLLAVVNEAWKKIFGAEEEPIN